MPNAIFVIGFINLGHINLYDAMVVVPDLLEMVYEIRWCKGHFVPFLAKFSLAEVDVKKVSPGSQMCFFPTRTQAIW